jgi:hypothetical protein
MLTEVGELEKLGNPVALAEDPPAPAAAASSAAAPAYQQQQQQQVQQPRQYHLPDSTSALLITQWQHHRLPHRRPLALPKQVVTHTNTHN